MLKKVLVPIDGSKLAEQVFPTVTELAAALKLEVTLFCVCESDSDEEREACRFYIKERAEQLKRSLEGSSSSVMTEVLPGKSAELIIRYAEIEKVDLIILMSHGRSGIMPWSLGSTADRILRRTNTPLIIIRAGKTAEEARIFSRIAVPMDHSEKAQAIIPYLKEVTTVIPCEIFPIGVVEAGRHVHTIGGLDYIPFRERDIEETIAGAKRHLERICADLSQTKAKVTCEVRVGDAAGEILKYADEIGATLIAMSAHGHSLIESWTMGSVAQKIVSAAQRSIFLVPSLEEK
jgi:nucleotide-binding universal stress UspA family protein